MPLQGSGRPRGLALGGGGLWGLAHVGVLEELQKAEIPIDMIGGASMGALVGGVAAGYIDDERRLRREGIEAMLAIARNIRHFDQFKEERRGENVLPVEALLAPMGQDERRSFLSRTPSVPYWAQVTSYERGRRHPETFLTIRRGETMREIMEIARASAANAVMFKLNPVRLDGIIESRKEGPSRPIAKGVYSDDPTIARRSTSAMSTKLRAEGAKEVWSVPVGFIDTDIWLPLRWVQDRISATLRDRGDVVFEPKERRGLLAGKHTLTNFGSGVLASQKFARSEADLEVLMPRRVPIPVEEFIEAGRQAARKTLGRIGL